MQELPASTDAFVWLRLYQVEMEELIAKGRRQPLWWTARRPSRPLTYHAVHRMFERANDRAGTAATLHSLRHTAAYRTPPRPGRPASHDHRRSPTTQRPDPDQPPDEETTRNPAHPRRRLHGIHHRIKSTQDDLIDQMFRAVVPIPRVTPCRRENGGAARCCAVGRVTGTAIGGGEHGRVRVCSRLEGVRGAHGGSSRHPGVMRMGWDSC